MGHVVFIDRLLHPQWDGELCAGAEIKSSDLGSSDLFFNETLR